ncbi:50S ribosomal protein L16 3-hydroxylase [Bisgaardia hudsonensis]|uniref:50S ribosomal protein L16 3-hydroxylase n=1 Tax=Bisgaardia hudsonensis TaxID=109472 RepID=A0A4R2N2T2_9PAST|nr:cupin domain-containing protein [Bisgaardia hudsonensis]QLB12629.1 ribosomal oxygenase [Bisgaardia hudsonensis]TCP14171.1 50S ribosomal protein L16 3-hydroxylase [Bisgaardia hudsonensis]
MTKFCLPDHITPEIFLRDYWQKKPLFIKNGLPQIVGLFEPDDIIELSQSEDVTSRLLKQISEDKWTLKISPLNKKDFRDLPKKWSVLVQNMEQWSTELGELWNAFGFIPQWQRDDIMVSYAPKGGSVGKHYDEYDVFLVQGYGHRRWQLGKWCDPSTSFKENQPIRIFDDMGDIIFDEIMEPGDILYVPSRLSHYGIAQDDCLTFSFGLRYPNLSSLLENISDIFTHQNSHVDLNSFNIPLRLTPNPQDTGMLSESMISLMKKQLLSRLIESSEFDQLFSQVVAKTVSSRRYEVLPTNEMVDIDEVRFMLEKDNMILKQDNNCKLLYREQPLEIYANGELLDELNPLESEILKRLSNGETISFEDLNKLALDTEDQETTIALLLDSICNWIDDGWVLLDE